LPRRPRIGCETADDPVFSRVTSSCPDAAMSHKHENLLRAIFHDPVSGNIHWREVESLLNHLGATLESLPGARIRVKLNGYEGIVHRPHHGNSLGRQDVLHVREYLAHARATPSQVESGKSGPG
jgi:hypothetical protein